MMSLPVRYAANCSLLFTELPLLQRAAAAAAAGFDAVEFWWPFASAAPTDTEVAAFEAGVRDAGVQLVGLNLFAGDMPAGDRGLVSWPGRARELADSVDIAVGLGAALGCTAFNALYGNRLDGVAAQEQDDLAEENLAAAARAVAAIDGVVLVEAVSGAPRYPLRTAADAVAVVRRARARHGAPDIAFLCDLYHLAVGGDDLEAVIDEHTPLIAHVQVADSPGRGEPGTGSLPLAALLARLADRGYAGRVALEYKPTTTTEESLAWLPREQRRSGTGALETTAASS